MNLANKLTMLRVVMIPAFVIVLYADFEGCRYVALALFAIASFTDFLDGYIARSRCPQPADSIVGICSFS